MVATASSSASPTEIARTLNKLDQEGEAYMKHAEKKCRRLNTVDDIKLRMSICKEKCDYFRKHGQRHRRQHLKNCLKAAQDRADETAEQNILTIIK